MSLLHVSTFTSPSGKYTKRHTYTAHFKMCVWRDKIQNRQFIIRTNKLKTHTGCPRRNGQNFGRVFLMLNCTDITQNTYIQSWTVTEIMAIEKCGLLGCPRTVSRPWRNTHPLRMPGNEKPLANIGMQWPWRDKDSCGLCKLLAILRTNTTVVRVFL